MFFLFSVIQVRSKSNEIFFFFFCNASGAKSDYHSATSHLTLKYWGCVCVYWHCHVQQFSGVCATHSNSRCSFYVEVLEWFRKRVIRVRWEKADCCTYLYTIPWQCEGSHCFVDGGVSWQKIISSCILNCRTVLTLPLSLFSVLQSKNFKGHHFSIIANKHSRGLHSILEEVSGHCFKQWKEYWIHCINTQRFYFEKY